jgi:hypothetical protein
MQAKWPFVEAGPSLEFLCHLVFFLLRSDPALVSRLAQKSTIETASFQSRYQCSLTIKTLLASAPRDAS